MFIMKREVKYVDGEPAKSPAGFIYLHDFSSDKSQHKLFTCHTSPVRAVQYWWLLAYWEERIVGLKLLPS